MNRIIPSLRNQGAKYSTLGIARTSRDRFGVPPCHERMSRKNAVPAGAGHTVDNFIHSGSSIRFGIGARDRWVPGICRIGPFSNVRAIIGKFIVRTGTGTSRIVTLPNGSGISDHMLSERSPWYSNAPGMRFRHQRHRQHIRVIQKSRSGSAWSLAGRSAHTIRARATYVLKPTRRRMNICAANHPNRPLSSSHGHLPLTEE